MYNRKVTKRLCYYMPEHQRSWDTFMHLHTYKYKAQIDRSTGMTPFGAVKTIAWANDLPSRTCANSRRYVQDCSFLSQIAPAPWLPIDVKEDRQGLNIGQSRYKSHHYRCSRWTSSDLDSGLTFTLQSLIVSDNERLPMICTWSWYYRNSSIQRRPCQSWNGGCWCARNR